MTAPRPFDGAMARYTQATEPPDAVRAALKSRVADAVGASGSILREHPAPIAPDAAASARVRARVNRSRKALETPWTPSFVGRARPRNPWQAPAFAAAALACVAIGLLWWQKTQPVDLPAPMVEVAPVALPETELAADESGTLSPVPGLELALAGQGSLSGTAEAPVVNWRRGRLDVEVDPAEGIGLVVQTDEGEVRVVGTGFSVDRDLLGTNVEVRHGRVIVACREAKERLLSQGGRATCLPVTPAGLLGRARTLGQQGAPVDQVLTAADAGLRASPSRDGVWGELQYLRMRALERSDRVDEARVAASEYVASGQLPRRADALRLAGGER